MLTVPFCTLQQAFQLVVPDQASHRVLDYIRARPNIEGPPLPVTTLVAEPFHGVLRTGLSDGTAFEGSANSLLHELHRIHYEISRAERPEQPLLHAATIAADAGQVLVIGDKGSGKTTLMVHLAAHGWAIAGDENAFLSDGMAIARPRSLRVKAGALRLLEQADADLVRASPSIADWNGASIYAVEPSAFGRPWVIASRPVAAVVFLTSNFGGRSRIQRLRWQDAFERLLPNTLLPTAGKARALATLRSLAATPPCWELWHGRLDDTAQILTELGAAPETGL